MPFEKLIRLLIPSIKVSLSNKKACADTVLWSFWSIRFQIQTLFEMFQWNQIKTAL